MAVNAIPYQVQTVAMDGTWKSIAIAAEWVTTQIQMRDSDIDLQIGNAAGTAYWTVKAGTVQHFSSGNFSAGESVDRIYLKAASGTVEVLGFLRR